MFVMFMRIYLFVQRVSSCNN